MLSHELLEHEGYENPDFAYKSSVELIDASYNMHLGHTAFDR